MTSMLFIDSVMFTEFSRPIRFELYSVFCSTVCLTVGPLIYSLPENHNENTSAVCSGRL